MSSKLADSLANIAPKVDVPVEAVASLALSSETPVFVITEEPHDVFLAVHKGDSGEHACYKLGEKNLVLKCRAGVTTRAAVVLDTDVIDAATVEAAITAVQAGDIGELRAILEGALSMQ